MGKNGREHHSNGSFEKYMDSILDSLTPEENQLLNKERTAIDEAAFTKYVEINRSQILNALPEIVLTQLLLPGKEGINLTGYASSHLKTPVYIARRTRDIMFHDVFESTEELRERVIKDASDLVCNYWTHRPNELDNNSARKKAIDICEKLQGKRIDPRDKTPTIRYATPQAVINTLNFRYPKRQKEGPKFNKVGALATFGK